MSDVTLRPETPADIDAVRAVIAAAFAEMPYSDQTEHLVIDRLRAAGGLSLALVALLDGEIVGHIAFSPVNIDGRDRGWYGLAPVTVHPDHQHRGIGGALIREGLQRLRERGAAGCVLLGEPEYYGRFGFRADPALVLEGVPSENFQALPFGDATPRGEVRYHRAFEGD